MIYDNSDGTDNFIELNGQSLMWQGESFVLPIHTYLKSCLYKIFSGGYVPRDVPTSEMHNDRLLEIIITSITAALGIMSTVYFFAFNICHRNNP